MAKSKTIKSERFALPASQADGIIELASLGGIASATGWKRAAIVYAMTAPGTNQNDAPAGAAAGARESFKAFARRGIVGLTRHETVSAYHAAWSAAGEPGITLGVKVNLPTEAFEDVYVTTKDGRTYAIERAVKAEAKAEAEVKAEAKVEARKMLRDDPKLVVEAIQASPAVAQAVVADDVLGSELDSRREAARFGRSLENLNPDGTPKPRDDKFKIDDSQQKAEKNLSSAFHTITRVLEVEADADWNLGGGMLILMKFSIDEMQARLSLEKDGTARMMIDGLDNQATLDSIEGHLAVKAERE